MNFYRRRPLVLIFTLCIAVSAACAFLPWYAKLILLFVVAAAVPIIIFALKRRGISHACNMPARAFVSMAAAFVMSAILLCVGYYDVHVSRFSALTEGEVEAVVINVQNSAPYAETYAVRMLTCDGTKYYGKGLIRFDTSLGLSGGDIIRVRVSFVALEDFYDFYDASRISLLSDGYVFSADALSEAEIWGESNGAEHAFLNIRRTISAKIALYLGRDSANIVRALFLGERGNLGVFERDFTYTGTSHILALSGMHLAVLAMAADKLFKSLSFPRKIRCAAIIAVVAAYGAMTGFLVSVSRAGIMLSVYYIAMCMRSESDRLTALFGAAWLIVTVNPAAVFDVGLHLSFVATLGVVLMAEASAHNEGRGYFLRTGLVKRTADDFRRSIVISLGAVFFVLPLQWLYFGEVSTLSLPATLLLSVLCSGILMFTLPYLLLVVLKWHFAASIVGALIDAVCEIMAHIAGFLSEHARLVWLGYPFVLPIILCTAAVILCMVFRQTQSWVYALIPIGVACMLFFGGVFIPDALCEGRVTLDYSVENESDMLFLMSGDNGTVIDCSNGTAAAVNMIADALDKRGESELDTLILTELTRRHIGAVKRLLCSRKVGCIIFPEPHGEYELYIASDIMLAAEEYGTETKTYERTENSCEFYIGDMHITFAQAVKLSRSERELLAFSAEISGVRIAYFGASAWEDDGVWSLASEADYMIIGRHGPTVKDGPPGSIDTEKKLIFISCEETGAFDGWLSDYTGRVRYGNEFSMVIDP